MPPYWVIGIGAGLFGALLFLTASSGSLLFGFPLFFAALPVFIAGLGWGERAAGIAAFVGFLVLSSLSSFTAGLVFFIADGLTPVWLSRLALLHHLEVAPTLTPAQAARLARKDGKPTDRRDLEVAPPPAPEDPQIDWYPPGALAVWTALIGSGVLVVSGLSSMILGLEGGLEGALRALFAEELLEGRVLESVITAAGLDADPNRLLNLIVIALPAFVVMAWSLLTLGNMWLAQAILQRAGRELRPMPNFEEMELPDFLLALLGGALILSVLPGPAAQLGGAIFIALLVPYFLLGLAVIHAISRAWTARIPILGVFYVLLLFTGWLIIPICLIGMLEPWAGLRARFASAEAQEGEEID